MNTVRLRRLVCRRGGAVAVEYALILPMLLLFVIGIIDVGRLLWTFTTLNRAAEAAARCGAVNSIDCGTAAAIQNHAVDEAWGMNIAAAAFAVTTPACGVQVTGTYDFVFAIPALATTTPLGTVTLKATACYPVMTSGG
jgi:Flp pilus assembly protein TadG